MNKSEGIHKAINELIKIHNELEDDKKLSLKVSFNGDRHRYDKGKYIIYDKVVGILDEVAEKIDTDGH